MVRSVRVFRQTAKATALLLVTVVVLEAIQRTNKSPDVSKRKFGGGNKQLNAAEDVGGRWSVGADTVNTIRSSSDYGSPYHVYNDSVDLRIIVMTYNRPDSLQKTLSSLQDFSTDGRQVSLEIWIDRQEHSADVDPETLRVARNFRWTKGPANVWIHGRHVGLIGQWMYTWRPRLPTEGAQRPEHALFVEDDVDVSKYGYRWLRAVRRKYGSRNDVACYTLQNDNAIGSYGKYRNKEIKKPSNSPVFFHRLPGSWAMSPDPEKWRRFQDWFETKRADPTFRPYVKKAAIQTEWYKIFEKQNRQDSMWTMWYIFYTNERNQICAYANLPAYTKRNDTSLARNRREPGLHYNKQMQSRYKTLGLLTTWRDEYVLFPDKPPIFDFGGEIFHPRHK